MSPGAIAVIELRGTRAADVLQTVTRRRGNDQPIDFIDGRLVLCRLMDDKQILDEAIAVTWAGGRMAELHLHGGVRIVERAMQLLNRAGAVTAGPDREPPGVDWVESEIDAALMTAHTRHMTRWLLSQRRLLPAFISAGVLSTIEPDLARRARAAAMLVRGITIAIVGSPNVGKSTLANRLIGHERIITSDIPGTTRDWVSETASVLGWPVTLTDTAGIRRTSDPIEQEAIRRGVQVAHVADLLLVVLDASRPDAERVADLATLSRDLPPGLPSLHILNKCDLTHSPSKEMISVSALTGLGRESLEAAIATRLGLDSLDENSPAPFTTRQWNAIGIPDADQI